MTLAKLATLNPDGLTPNDIRTLGQAMLDLQASITLSILDCTDALSQSAGQGRPAPLYQNPDGTREGRP